MNYEIKTGEAPKEWYNQWRFHLTLECTFAELYYLRELVRNQICDWKEFYNFLLLPSEADRDIVPSWMEQPGGELELLCEHLAEHIDHFMEQLILEKQHHISAAHSENLELKVANIALMKIDIYPTYPELLFLNTLISEEWQRIQNNHYPQIDYHRVEDEKLQVWWASMACTIMEAMMDVHKQIEERHKKMLEN